MIQAVPATKSPSVSAASRGVPASRKFALALAAAPGGKDDADPDDADTTAATDGEARHDGADDGTDLPPGMPLDPRLAWFALPVAVPSGTPAPTLPPGTIGTGAAAGSPPAPPAGPATRPPPQMPVADATTPPVVPLPVPQAVTATLAIPSDAGAPAPQPAKTPEPVAPEASPAGPLPIALPDPARAATATPALQAFAGAMRAALKVDETPARKDATDPVAAPGATATAPLETVRHAVAATGAAQDRTLDTRREHWPQTMIDHIETLRDAADATSSRIRVVPDALGTIDLSVKRDGDTLHVHFAAEQAATRTLLADAQPRLAEIAQSRGLRLGDTDVGGGGSGAHQRAPAPAIPLTPTPIPARATSAAVATDTRIA